MSEKNTSSPSLFMPAVLLGAGIALGFTLLGTFIYKSIYFFKTEDYTIKVRGLAEETVKSDLAKLSFEICTFGDTMQSAYKLSKTQVKETMNFLLQSGYNASEISISQSSVIDREINNHNSNKIIEKDKRYYVDTYFKVKTKKVDDITLLSDSVNSLAEKGITISEKFLRFTYSDFTKKRPELLKKAALDAKSAAKQVAKEMSVTLGDLQGSQQSNVEINNEDDISSGESLYKKLRVIFTTIWGIKATPPHTSAE